jgi:membrane protein YqaA with SNARE-associated domain
VSAVLASPAALGLAVCVGAASAFVPFVNAELAVSGAAVGATALSAVCVAVAVAAGQTCGKLAIFEAGRRGAVRHRSGRRRETEPLPHWQSRATSLLTTRWSGGGIVLLSATLGLPPLALVSAAAGIARARRGDFVVCCLLGRTARFVAVAVTVVSAWRP